MANRELLSNNKLINSQYLPNLPYLQSPLTAELNCGGQLLNNCGGVSVWTGDVEVISGSINGVQCNINNISGSTCAVDNVLTNSYQLTPSPTTTGTATLVAGVAIVSNINVGANDIITLTRLVTLPNLPTNASLAVEISPQTGFKIVSSSNTDTDSIRWFVLSVI